MNVKHGRLCERQAVYLGPVEAIDCGRLDTMLYANSAMYKELKDPTYAPLAFLRRRSPPVGSDAKPEKDFMNTGSGLLSAPLRLPF